MGVWILIGFEKVHSVRHFTESAILVADYGCYGNIFWQVCLLLHKKNDVNYVTEIPLMSSCEKCKLVG